MKSKIYILIILQLFISSTMSAQDLTQHQWKNRVLAILSDTINNLEFKDQIKELQNKTKALEERKLIIYQITPNEYKAGLSGGNNWIKRPELYRDIKTKDKPFEVILIGLDGGEKLRQNTVLSTDKLFSIIDGMPMRRAELRKNE